ncbi:uncharacterized protein EHS24_006773 [Apiotrichum porosum]|uniref:Uncharacterized protein n=1 Tax=Apiotrichum porosum TaxID=105984 RepID=A0A427XW36_9TREE|nr:uncharacterized protein EHS24_006773 [Apiotrichum porosum]RSH83116.1 hypothetical protein EHS24_006773 [Apiotrichum porosum]
MAPAPAPIAPPPQMQVRPPVQVGGQQPVVVRPPPMAGQATPSPATPTGPAPLPQTTIAQLAAFFAATNHQALVAQAVKAGTTPPQPITQLQAQHQFLALQPQQQRQVQANFIARSRLAQQQPQAPQRPVQLQVHPSLMPGSGPPQQPPARRGSPAQPNVTGGTQQQPPQSQPPAPPAAPPRSKASKESAKRLRVEVPEVKPPPPPPPPVSHLTAIVRSAIAPRLGEQDEDAAAEARRRAGKDDGFRGSMRGEIARLMYASGDVVEPDVDSVDYVEDLVMEFVADLCRPIQPMRVTTASAHSAVPLTADVVRHRLATHSYLRKYLSRWDDMTYMSAELLASRRVAAPSHADLIESVGKQFLGLDEQEAGNAKRRANNADAGAEIDSVKRRGRPPKNPEERKKPGPKKGWKKNIDPNAPPKKRATRPYKKRDRPMSVSVAPSPTKQPPM